MSVANSQVVIPLEAAADLSAAANLYKIVELTGANQVNVANAASDKLLGVLQNRPESGEAAAVAIGGRVKVKAGAAVAVNDRLTADANGRAIATTTAGNTVIGFATSAASAADEIIDMVIVHANVPA